MKLTGVCAMFSKNLSVYWLGSIVSGVCAVTGTELERQRACLNPVTMKI